MAMATSIDEMMSAYNSIFQQWLNLSQPFISPGRLGMVSSDSDCATDTAEIFRALLQALSAASTSSLSYGCATQSIIYKYQASLLELNLSDADSKHKRAMLIDETRGFLREIGESASREGRKFQLQLAKIAEQLAQAEASANQGQ